MQVRPLIKGTESSNRNSIIAVMLFLVVLSIVLTNVAFVQNDELLEDDFLAREGWVGIWIITLISLLFLSNLDSRLHILVIAIEYLRSHIGEKRFSDSLIDSDNSFNLFLIANSRMTALF